MSIFGTPAHISKFHNGNATSIACTSISTSTGDLICVHIFAALSSANTLNSVTDTIGNTYTIISATSTASGSQANSGTAGTVWVAYCLGSTGTNASNIVTANFASTQAYQGIAVTDIPLSGGTALFDVNQYTQGNTASTTPTSTAFATGGSDEIVIVGADNVNTGQTYTAGTGFTIMETGTNNSGFLGTEFEKFTSTQASLAPKFTTSSSTFMMSSIGFKASSGSPIVAAIAGTSAVTGAVTGSGALAGVIAGTSVVTAALGSFNMTASLVGTSTVTGLLTGNGALAGAINGTSSVTALISEQVNIAAAITGVATVSASLSEFNLTASLIGTATVTAILTGGGALASAINGTSSVSASTGGTGALSASIAGVGTVSASIASFNLTASVTGTATVNGLLLGLAPIAAVINGASVVTASISKVTATTAFINGYGYVVSFISGLPQKQPKIPNYVLRRFVDPGYPAYIETNSTDLQFFYQTSYLPNVNAGTVVPPNWSTPGTPDGFNIQGRVQSPGQLMLPPGTGSLNGKIYRVVAQGMVYIPEDATGATFNLFMNQNYFTFGQMPKVDNLFTLPAPISEAEGMYGWQLSATLVGNGVGTPPLFCKWSVTMVSLTVPNGYTTFNGTGYSTNPVTTKEPIIQLSMGIQFGGSSGVDTFKAFLSKFQIEQTSYLN